MRPWYESVVAQRLKCVVFHDRLSLEFVKQHESPDIRFVLCELGPYSLNDERFFIYRDVLRRHRVRGAFATDISDVVVNSDPARLLDSKARLFVGRDRWDKIRCSDWMRSKLESCAPRLGIACDGRFEEQPLYNAGIVGGHHGDLLALLDRMTATMSLLDDSENNNMVVLNYVIYRHYLPPEHAFKAFTGQMRTNPRNDADASIHPIRTGFPVCSEYKAYERGSQATFTHK